MKEMRLGPSPSGSTFCELTFAASIVARTFSYATQGLVPKSAGSGAADPDGDGHTKLEDYLN